MDFEKLQQIKKDPIKMGEENGYKIPPDLAGDPQAMVMHLINSGQVSSPKLQRIMPLIQRMQGK